MAITTSVETTERPSGDSSSLDLRWDAPSSNRIDDAMVELHWEISIEHWVPYDRSRLNRVRWFIWDLVGIGNPPSRAERASAEEVTMVMADSVPNLPTLPNRRLVKVVSRKLQPTG
jgi:hypothetical protein